MKLVPVRVFSCNTPYDVNCLKGHFTVKDGSKAGVDVVLIQTFLLYYVYQVILMLTSVSIISITKQRRFVSKQGHRQPHIHSKARILSPQL